jgi:hypothetical protein
MSKSKFYRADLMPTRRKDVRSILVKYRDLIGAKEFIETGTYHGATVELMIREFDRIMSVELSEKCLEVARIRVERQDRFGRIKGKPPAEVELVLGNSLEVLPKFLDSLTGPCVFWLDAHYSPDGEKLGYQDCTAFQELQMILRHSSNIPSSGDGASMKHAIIIDDARFMGKGDYPTIAQLVREVRDLKDRVRIKVDLDTIQISPIINK